jgi:predicted aspartyl protease
VGIRNASAGIIAAILTLASASARAAETCGLIETASLDMGVDTDGRVYVPMTISGHQENMLVDTAGVFSMLLPRTVDEIGLQRQTANLVDANSHFVRMYGGAVVKQFVVADIVQLGLLSAKDMTLFVMPDEFRVSSQIGGLLAPDVLRRYDVDFDFAKGKLNLFSPDHCEGQVVYWTQQPFAKIPIKVDSESGHITASVELDGKDVEATLDTGTSRSLMRLESARSLFGWGNDTAALKPVGTPSKDADTTEYRYPFHALTIDAIQVLNPDLVLVPDKVSGKTQGVGPAIIMGIGILRQLHLYIAYREHTLYATAAGQR